MRREQEVYIYHVNMAKASLSTEILSEILYKILLYYNQCQVKQMLLNSKSVRGSKSSFSRQDGHDCTCIGTSRWKENKNVPNVIFKSVQDLTELC